MVRLDAIKKIRKLYSFRPECQTKRPSSTLVEIWGCLNSREAARLLSQSRERL